ncbi:MAG: phosphonoacetaldehyde hydrolase, partial [Burkholderiales bacterium]|nr:phosphonoacetaldehyde hydrolase [Burkholderiales bacterium]
VDLNVWPSRSVVKVDDTIPGLLEGYHSDCWTVGVIASGNEAGLTYQQWMALTEHEKTLLRKRVAARLAAGHPDFLIDTVADLPSVLAKIQQLLAQRP